MIIPFMWFQWVAAFPIISEGYKIPCKIRKLQNRSDIRHLQKRFIYRHLRLPRIAKAQPAETIEGIKTPMDPRACIRLANS
jgi:hypothetical protein